MTEIDAIFKHIKKFDYDKIVKLYNFLSASIDNHHCHNYAKNINVIVDFEDKKIGKNIVSDAEIIKETTARLKYFLNEKYDDLEKRVKGLLSFFMLIEEELKQ